MSYYGKEFYVNNTNRIDHEKFNKWLKDNHIGSSLEDLEKGAKVVETYDYEGNLITTTFQVVNKILVITSLDWLDETFPSFSQDKETWEIKYE